MQPKHPDLEIRAQRVRHEIDRERARIEAIQPPDHRMPRQPDLLNRLRFIEDSVTAAEAIAAAIPRQWAELDRVEAMLEPDPSLALSALAIMPYLETELDPDELPELESTVLELLAAAGRYENFQAFVHHIDHWLRASPSFQRNKSGPPAMDDHAVAAAIRRLRAAGILDQPRADTSGLYKLTPWGKAIATLHTRQRYRRQRRERGHPAPRLETTLPPREEIGPGFEDLHIDFLDLSKRTRNTLKRAGIETVGAIVGKTEKELLQLKSVGKKSVEEIACEVWTLEMDLASPALLHP